MKIFIYIAIGAVIFFIIDIKIAISNSKKSNELYRREKEHFDAYTKFLNEQQTFKAEEKRFREDAALREANLAQREKAISELKYTLGSFADTTVRNGTYLFNFKSPVWFQDTDKAVKYIRAVSGEFSLSSPVSVSCSIQSHDQTYTTTLTSCTCQSFVNNHEPCKHMIWLALRLGALAFKKNEIHNYEIALGNQLQKTLQESELLSKRLSLYENRKSIIEQIERDRKDVKVQCEQANDLSHRLQRQSSELEHQKNLLFKHKKNVDDREATISAKEEFIESRVQIEKDRMLILSETEQAHPGFAQLMLHYSEYVDELRYKKFCTKAYNAADTIKQIRAEKCQLILERDLYFAQLAVYESLFPWLEEFKELPISDAKAYVDTVPQDEQEYYRDWLSPSEFQALSPTERLQMKLDRWKKRKRSDWEAGIEYERYIGYLYEKDGYVVDYHGANKGLQDMGRDLVAVKCGEALIIQCKRWKRDKKIHEKHVFQLFGTGILYGIQNPAKQTHCVFVTTASLSPTARQCAEKLNVRVKRVEMGDYPLIKCNINRTTGEHIYHLPFDQQYDHTVIEPNTGETYVSTVAEAEILGFRHAFKHIAS